MRLIIRAKDMFNKADFIPNTAVFGPTNFIGTTTTTTTTTTTITSIASRRMTVYALDEKGRFLR